MVCWMTLYLTMPCILRYEAIFALAAAILDALRARRSFGWPDGVPTPVIDPAQCAAHFGMGRTDWKPVCAVGGVVLFRGRQASVRSEPVSSQARGVRGSGPTNRSG